MVSAKEAVQFFREANVEVAELVLELGQREVSEKLQSKAAISVRMAKARAGRSYKGKRGKRSTDEAAAHETETSPIEEARQRAAGSGETEATQ